MLLCCIIFYETLWDSIPHFILFIYLHFLIFLMYFIYCISFYRGFSVSYFAFYFVKACLFLLNITLHKHTDYVSYLIWFCNNGMFYGIF